MSKTNTIRVRPHQDEPSSPKRNPPPHYEETNGRLKTDPDHAQQHTRSHHRSSQHHHNQHQQQNHQHHNNQSEHNSPRHHPNPNPNPNTNPPPPQNHVGNQSRSKKESDPPQISLPIANSNSKEFGNGNRVYCKELQLETFSDKENQNSWFTPNHHNHHHPHHQYNGGGDQIGSTIPVVPFYTTPNDSSSNPAYFHKNNTHQPYLNGGANHDHQTINYSNGKSPIPSPNHLPTPTPHHHQHQNGQNHVRRINFVGYEEQLQQDLLSMGRIQELRDRMGAERTKMNEKALWKCLGAEFLGTSMLLFLGIGCVLKMEHEVTKQLSFVGVALCWGFTVATIAQALGGVSADLNPAITLASAVTGKLPVVKAIMYILMQCLGALAGTSLLKAVTPDNVEGDWGITKLAPGVTPIQGCVIEIISTFILTFTVFSANDENRNDVKGSVPLAVGICVAAIVMCSGPLTGASLNPARSLGPSIVAGHFEEHWVYWMGPMLGGIAAGLIYTHVFRALRPDEMEALEAEQQLRQREREAKENSPAV